MLSSMNYKYYFLSKEYFGNVFFKFTIYGEDKLENKGFEFRKNN